MPKKWKKKIQKQQKAQIIQQSVAENEKIEVVDINESSAVKPIIETKKSRHQQVVEKDNFLPEVKQVKKDIKKIIIIFGVIVTTLIIIKILDNKNDLVLKIADFITKLFK